MGLKQGPNSIGQWRAVLCLQCCSLSLSCIPIPNRPHAANSLMQIINNGSICSDLELLNYFGATLSALFPEANYEVGMKEVFIYVWLRGNGKLFLHKRDGNVSKCCWEMVLLSEIISILSISVCRKLDKQKVPYWAPREVNGLTAIEKQEDLLSYVCSQCKIWWKRASTAQVMDELEGISCSSGPTLDFGRTG